MVNLLYKDPKILTLLKDLYNKFKGTKVNEKANLLV